MLKGKRQRGRPARRWIDDIVMWCGQDISNDDREPRQLEGIRSYTVASTVFTDHRIQGRAG